MGGGRILYMAGRQASTSVTRVESFKQEIGNWASGRRLTSLSFTEDNDPPVSKYDDYQVVYEARFIPSSLSQARLELMLTDRGFVGVGLETRRRIAERLKVRNQSEGFAAGFEPRLNDVREVLLLLDVVSSGEFAIQARVFPWCGLGRTKALVTSKREGAAELFRKFYCATSLRSGFCTQILTFEPWR